MSIPVKVDRAFPKTLPQPLRWPWYCFPSQSYNYFRYPSAVLKFLGEGSVGWGWHIHQWKTSPENIGIATEIASISVFVVKYLVLPVWGTVSTSDLYQMLFSEVGRCRYRWKWIGHAQKLCRSRWHHVDISSRHLLITTSGFRPPSWIFKCRKCQTRLAWVRRKNLERKSLESRL